jgi:hypothetical protein
MKAKSQMTFAYPLKEIPPEIAWNRPNPMVGCGDLGVKLGLNLQCALLDGVNPLQ